MNNKLHCEVCKMADKPTNEEFIFPCGDGKGLCIECLATIGVFLMEQLAKGILAKRTMEVENNETEKS